MKTRFTSAELPHIWAHASAPSGTSPGSMSFDGPIFRSYATAIARRIEHKGKLAYVLNAQSFSVTTSNHQSLVRRAIPSGVPAFYVEKGRGTDLSVTGAELFEYAVTQASYCQAKAATARTQKDWHNGQAHKWLERAKEVSAFFGLKRKVDEKAIERLTASRLRAEKAERKAQAERREAVRKEAEECMARWISGESISGHYFHDMPTRFRVEGDELVSTKGARVPLVDAERAMRFALARREKGWRENGETCPVGAYRLNSITPDGIIAGCHRIAWDEVERVAGLLQSVTA